MSRTPTFRTSEFPYHVTARCNNKEWFQLSMPSCWEIFKKQIKEAEEKYNFKSYAFVLMNNHYHWLLSTPERNIDKGMGRFMTQTSVSIARATGRINRIYGGRYKPTLILDPEHFINAFRYVYLNPVKAKICVSPKDYPWSTFVDKGVSLSQDDVWGELIPRQVTSEWLLHGTTDEFFEKNRRALRRSIFKYPKEFS